MEKIKKNTGEIKEIKNSALKSDQQSIIFESFKNKVQWGQKVLVAVSGGADSILTATLMYNFFLKNKYNLQNLFFIHCNHTIRPGNQADEAFIKKFFEGTQIHISKRKSDTKHTEAELRNRRYGEFKKEIKKQHIDRLVFGHNLTDRIESTFLNLLRGANLNGFVAMQETEQHHLLPGTQIWRPLLWLSKQEILEICQHNKLPFVTDPTNSDITTSLRNRLRNKVLPELYALANKQTTTTNSFIESMKNIYQQVERSETQNNDILKPIHQSPYRNATFAYQWMREPKEISNESLMHVMKTLDISNNITAPLLKERTWFLQKNESGYKYFNKTYLFKSHGNIYFISAPQFFRKKTIESKTEIHKLWEISREGWETNITKKEYLGREIRFPKKGDLYKKKTRNEYCINQKIPIFRRNFLPVIADKHQIVSVGKILI